MAEPTPLAYAKELLTLLERDRDRLDRIDDYVNGDHDDPYMPDNADPEYKLLAQRAVSNWMPLLVSTPAQALAVDGFRRGKRDGIGKRPEWNDSPEWNHWQRSRLDARQAAIYRGALTFGHAFTLTEVVRDRVITKGLSPRRTAALYDDPANDDTPVVALTVKSWPREKKLGVARMWDETHEYKVTFKSRTETDKDVTVTEVGPHGASECPITRFAAAVDLEGRTVGVVEPMIALQNRINQTVFDLLVAQTYGSFKVRWVTGMAPPLKRDAEGEVVLDEDGQPIPLPIDVNAKRFLFAEDQDTHFGSLDETPLEGYISAIDVAIRHLSAISQTPPHYLLGQIANLSAEALIAAELALLRKVQEIQVTFGESWERVFRLAAELSDDDMSADDFNGEVIWRDTESRSLSAVADALQKMRELGIPDRALWSFIPGVTETQMNEWAEMVREGDPSLSLADALNRATPEPSVQSEPEPIAA